LQTLTEQRARKEYTPPAIRITRSRVAGDDDLISSLLIGETRNLRKEKKVQKELSPSPKKVQNEEKKKKKQNSRKKKQKADVKLGLMNGLMLSKNGLLDQPFALIIGAE
jgi:hypothetical protein